MRSDASTPQMYSSSPFRAAGGLPTASSFGCLLIGKFTSHSPPFRRAGGALAVALPRDAVARRQLARRQRREHLRLLFGAELGGHHVVHQVGEGLHVHLIQIRNLPQLEQHTGGRLPAEDSAQQHLEVEAGSPPH